MSKIILLGDTHFGARQDSIHFLNYQKKFFDDLLEYCFQNKIQDIVQVGDFFDKRTSINFLTLYHAKNILDKFRDYGIIIYIFVGNHDAYYKETLEVNSVDLLLREYPNIQVFTEPSTIQFSEVDATFDFIPWICKDNYDRVIEFVKNSKSNFCCGHFEFSGFPMYKGIIHDHGGFDSSLFSNKYRKVYSGHFHTRSKKENIEYIGTPYEITWMDYDDPRGFVVFDTVTLEDEFIQNKHSLFYVINYNDEEFDYKSFDFSLVKEKYVKVVIVKKTDNYQFDYFFTKLNESGCIDIKIIENFEEYAKGTVDEDIEVEQTIDVIGSYIDSIDLEIDKNKLKTCMKELYVLAINQET
jgi:DNA repair exonuclease SbcCD nuclease subunit